MPNVDTYLKRLKSLRSSVRDKAASDLCVKVLMHECGDDLPAVVNEIKAIYSKLGVGVRSIALDVVSRDMSEEDFLRFVKDELGYAYIQFRSAHGYLFKVLHTICQDEFKEGGLVGEYFDFKKQFELAFDLLKIDNSDALN